MKEDRGWFPYSYMSMDYVDMSANIGAVASGTIVCARIPETIPKGEAIDRIAFRTGSTGHVTLTSQVFALIRAWDRMILAKTVDDGATAWGANTWKALLLTAPYEFLAPTMVYLAMRVAATTPGTHAGIAMLTSEAGPPPPATTNGTTAFGAVGTVLPAATSIPSIYMAGCS